MVGLQGGRTGGGIPEAPVAGIVAGVEVVGDDLEGGIGGLERALVVTVCSCCFFFFFCFVLAIAAAAAALTEMKKEVVPRCDNYRWSLRFSA